MLPFTTDPKLTNTIKAYFQQELPMYLDLLRQMVEINSFTINTQGVNQLGALTAARFAELGFETETVQSANPNFGKHVTLTKPGSSSRNVGFISHLDTVFPPEEEIRNNFFWRPEGNRIYGPGTIDIKGGTLVIYMVLAALKQFQPQLYNEITWKVLLDASEEREAPDFGYLCLQHLDHETLAALVFEGGRIRDGNVFRLVAARKGIALFEVAVEGKAAHAGSSHTDGASAIVQMADTIQRIAALTDYERNLTFNVGRVAGGVVTNRVPHHARARVEMRAFAVDVFESGIADMLALTNQVSVKSVNDGYPCRVDIELAHRVDPWSPNPATDRLLANWQAAADPLGMIVEREERGGLSDGNLIWQQIPTLDGLGPAGGNAHCSERSPDGSKDQEFIYVPSLVPKALLNTMAVLRLVSDNRD